MAINAGKYIIRSALNENLVLMVSGGSTSKGAKITTGSLTETDNRCYWSVAKVASNVSNTFYNVKSGTKTGYIMAATVAAGKSVTQNAYKLATGAWNVVSSGNQMSVNGVDVNTYFIRPRSNSKLYLTIPDNGGDATLRAAAAATQSTTTTEVVGDDLGEVTVNKSTFQTAVDNTAGTYAFTYDGTDWILNEETVSLETYGISFDGTAAEDDSITVTFTAYVAPDTSNQEFYFDSSTYVKTSLATPKTLRTSEDKTYVIANGSTTFYPQWKSSSSAKVYEMRYRTRCYDMDGNVESWSDWKRPNGNAAANAWYRISAAPQLDKKKKYTGVMKSSVAITTPAVDNSTYSRADIQVQTRLTSASSVSSYDSNKATTTHGATVSQIINHWCNPSLNFTAALYSPDGLALAYNTNYTIAGSSITIHYIKDNGVTLIKDYTFSGQDFEGDLYLNCDELYSLPSAGDTINISATITAENGYAKKKISKNLTVQFDSSWGLTLNPTYTLTNKLSVLATIASYPTLQLYLEHKQLDGTSYWAPCDRVSENENNTVFEFAPPYNNSANLLWVVIDDNANWTSTVAQPTGITINSSYYSWYWMDDNNTSHAVFLKYNIGYIMQPSDDITLPANRFITTGREYPVFRYSKSVERILDIEGIILDGENDDYCKRADFESLAAANHCIYRQPDGKWFQVAIKDIKFTREQGYTVVSIGQEAETR